MAAASWAIANHFNAVQFWNCLPPDKVGCKGTKRTRREKIDGWGKLDTVLNFNEVLDLERSRMAWFGMSTQLATLSLH